MIEYRGDISRQDAQLLVEYASSSNRILEFGPGASTQVMAWAASSDAELVSVETDPWWIKRTQKNLADLGIFRPVEFLLYGTEPAGEFDLIFVDGADDKRLEFASVMWPKLEANGGCMLFHDTRRGNDLAAALQMALSFLGEVRRISINEGESNITVVEKRPRLDYVNWNIVEGRPSV